MTRERKLDREQVGAWVLSCNPEVFDLTPTADLRAPSISWSLARTYRTGMIALDDLVVLWVGGTASRTHIPGIWAYGTVIGPIVEGVGGGPDWVDEDRKNELRPYVPMMLTWLEPPLPKSMLQDDLILRDIEILRMPRMSNPSFLTPEDTDAVLGIINAEYAAPVQSRFPTAVTSRGRPERSSTDPVNREELEEDS